MRSWTSCYYYFCYSSFLESCEYSRTLRIFPSFCSLSTCYIIKTRFRIHFKNLFIKHTKALQLIMLMNFEIAYFGFTLFLDFLLFLCKNSSFDLSNENSIGSPKLLPRVCMSKIFQIMSNSKLKLYLMDFESWILANMLWNDSSYYS